jgi:excisionase family DNA binding protein
MRPSRSSPFLQLRSGVSEPEDATAPDGAGTSNAADGDKRPAPGASKSGSKILSPNIPSWAAAEVSRGHRSGTNAREPPDQYDSGTVRSCFSAAAVVKERLSLSKQRVAVERASRLEPLLTVVETAAILNVSVRTIRRLIASGAIPAISIGRSVRVRPRVVGRLIAKGGICNN